MEALVSFLKQYKVPLLLYILAILWQLFVLPSAFVTTTHYDALGIKRFSSVEEVQEAYVKLSSKWKAGEELPNIDKFVKVQYAFELLSNSLWKRDYDVFSVDEYQHVIEKIQHEYGNRSFSEVKLPILGVPPNAQVDHSSASVSFNTKDFIETLGYNGSWLIQVYSSGSRQCAQFRRDWERITTLLDGVARSGTVETGEAEVAAFLAEKRKITGHPIFANGLPSLVALPHGCRSTNCLIRYGGELSVDAVTDWMATTVLGLPRIIYYSKDSLVNDFVKKAGAHKVKVILFSETGERAIPFLRQAAKDYQAYASFAYIAWREEESSIWSNMFEVQSAPSVVFVRDPGVKPYVFHGILNSTWFYHLMEQNKNLVLPQLRNINSLDLGCDARGYSRSTANKSAWYCVVLAGRPSVELNNMRQTMRSIKDILSDENPSKLAEMHRLEVPFDAAKAMKESRLSLVWLDGEVQKKYCFFYVQSEHGYETCGPRNYGSFNDVPRIFLIRYERNSSSDDIYDKKHKGPAWNLVKQIDSSIASQLVARYNGSADVAEILKWMGQIIEDGESKELFYYKVVTPELVPEDTDQIWLKGAQALGSNGRSIRHTIRSLPSIVRSYLLDPRFGSVLFLAASISLGFIWHNRPQSFQPDDPNSQTQPEVQRSSAGKDYNSDDRSSRRVRRRHGAVRTGHFDSPTDFEPKDAHQWVTTDSDSE